MNSFVSAKLTLTERRGNKTGMGLRCVPKEILCNKQLNSGNRLDDNFGDTAAQHSTAGLANASKTD
jgi:hypothetical protein